MKKGRTIQVWPQDQLPANNTSGIRGMGIRIVGSTPHVWCTWSKPRRGAKPAQVGRTSFSTATHGRVGAVQKAMDLRSKKMGVEFPLSAAKAWKMMAGAAGL
jgi:hypothetical protein